MAAKIVPAPDYDDRVRTSFARQKAMATIGAELTLVTPGIIDAHSHMAAGGGINEGSSPVTPQVRMEDFVDDEDAAIYRALAGGTTLVNQLHGSANVIGGTSAVFKLTIATTGPAVMFSISSPKNGLPRCSS